MRKNSRLLGILLAAAVMAAVTGCSMKSNTEASTTETASQTTMAEETTATESSEEEDLDDTEDTTEEETETTASSAGTVSDNGAFQAVSGKFDITPPAGWTIAEGGNEQYVTFVGTDENDMIEVVDVSGGEADLQREEYPATAEEYLKLVSREDDGAEIISYDVKNGSDESQTFRYSMKFATPSDGIRYIAVSGSYDASKGKYTCVTGYAATEAAEKQVQAAVDSFKIK